MCPKLWCSQQPAHTAFIIRTSSWRLLVEAIRLIAAAAAVVDDESPNGRIDRRWSSILSSYILFGRRGTCWVRYKPRRTSRGQCKFARGQCGRDVTRALWRISPRHPPRGFPSREAQRREIQRKDLPAGSPSDLQLSLSPARRWRWSSLSPSASYIPGR